MVKRIGAYTVGLNDTLITIKDLDGTLLKAQDANASNAVDIWKETCEMVKRTVQAKRDQRTR